MDTPYQAPASTPAPKSGYGKRPLWQWILLYVVVGGIVYYGIYYFAYANKGGSNANDNTNITRSLY